MKRRRRRVAQMSPAWMKKQAAPPAEIMWIPVKMIEPEPLPEPIPDPEPVLIPEPLPPPPEPEPVTTWSLWRDWFWEKWQLITDYWRSYVNDK